MTPSLFLRSKMVPCNASHFSSPCASPALPLNRLRQLARRSSLLTQRLSSNGANGVRRSAGIALVASTRPRASGVAAPGDVPVVKELSKNFVSASEERSHSWWESEGSFKLNLERDGKPFDISMPPPNVTWALHMGHAMFVALEDIMTRHWRMLGRPSLWVPVTDHAASGRKMLASEGVKLSDIDWKDFANCVWEWKYKYAGTITDQMRWLGASCDWERLDDQLSKSVLEAFVRLQEKGLIYRGSYMVNWSPNLRTTVSDLVAGEPSTPCDSCNGRGWLVCDFCEGLKVNVQGKNSRIYRRCPSCRTAGVVICPRCKVFKCVSFPDDKDNGIPL